MRCMNIFKFRLALKPTDEPKLPKTYDALHKIASFTTGKLQQTKILNINAKCKYLAFKSSPSCDQMHLKNQILKITK